MVVILQLLEEVCNRDDKLCNEIMQSPQLFQSITNLVLNGSDTEGRTAMSILKVFIAKRFVFSNEYIESLHCKKVCTSLLEVSIIFHKC